MSIMARTFLLSLLSLFVSASAGACTPADSCPKLSDGSYCPVNDVTEHANINKDVKAIADKLKESPPNYAGAKTIYAEGLSSSKGAGKMRTLQSMALKDFSKGGTVTNVWYNGFVDLYGSYGDVWDKYIMECFNATGMCADKDDGFKKYIINKGLIGVVTGYVAYEMGSGLAKAASSQTQDTQAAYAWDEAAAFHIGNRPCEKTGPTASAICSLYSPYEFNWKRDLDFPNGTNTHTEAVKIFNFGLLNLRGDAYDATNAEAAEKAIYKIYAIAAIRSAIKYSKKASSQLKYVAEGWAYWRSASGYIAQLSAEAKATVKEIDALFDLSQTSVPTETYCQVKAKVETLYAAIGIDCDMVGTWKDDDGSCSACSGSGGSLHSGSTDYVDMCKPADDHDGHDHGSTSEQPGTTSNQKSLCSISTLVLAVASATTLS